MIKAPAKIPAPPTPAIARPMIKASELGAAPHIAEPTSKMKMAVKKTHFTGKKVYSLPNISWKAQVVSRYELPYQPTSSRALN